MPRPVVQTAASVTGPSGSAGAQYAMTCTRRGFSLIELLVVIGILLVLLGLATWGISAAQRSGRTQQTHIALSNLKGMYTEMDVSGGLSRQPTHMWDTT